MAFCKLCGTDLNGAKFCPNCGTADGEIMVQQQGYGMAHLEADLRQRSLVDMQKLMDYFGIKSQQYDEFSKVSEEVEERRKYLPAIWIVGAIACLLLGCFNKLFYIGMVACIALAIVFSRHNKKKLTEAVDRQDQLGVELATHYEAFGYCPLGIEYTKPSTLFEINEIIRKGRKNTIADAVNQYEDDNHKRIMEINAKMAADAARETAENSKSAAKSAKRAAGYSAASFWLK